MRDFYKSEGKVVGQTEVIFLQSGTAKKYHHHHHHHRACEGVQQEMKNPEKDGEQD